jgi:glucan phosphorylase
MDISEHNPIAYLCAEYGLEARLPIYAGGLGVLAGDTLKAAADLNLPVVGIGLMYHGEAAKQIITSEGEQLEESTPFDELSQGLEHVYIDDKPVFVKVHLTQVDVWLRVWKKQIGPNVTLYLLDSDTEQNHIAERDITKALYIGTNEMEVKQQMLLGIGGVKLLRELGINPALYHINEGRPAFAHWQMIREMMDHHGMSYADAKKEAISQTVYTNHTLVAAGNKGYSVDLIKVFAEYYAQKMGISVEELLKDGTQEHPELFKMTRFALNTSRKANGVSALHSKLSKEAWPEYNWINVTNGVHMPTWQDERFRSDNLSDNDIWQIHQDNKRQLMEFVQDRTGYGYDPNRLVISWARRVAGYKQLDQVFADVERLRALLAQQDKPATLLIAGKAHYGDTWGKGLIKKIITHMSRELSGLALFIPNYDLDVAHHLIRGSDIWLNTPQYGKEASGTSGMKAISNGVLNLTVSDGWVPEADWNQMGWILNHNDLSNDLYTKLETEIAPLYYQRNSQNQPQDWIKMMRKSIHTAQQFSARRMVSEYRDNLYN